MDFVLHVHSNARICWSIVFPVNSTLVTCLFNWLQCYVNLHDQSVKYLQTGTRSVWRKLALSAMLLQMRQFTYYIQPEKNPNLLNSYAQRQPQVYQHLLMMVISKKTNKNTSFQPFYIAKWLFLINLFSVLKDSMKRRIFRRGKYSLLLKIYLLSPLFHL